MTATPPSQKNQPSTVPVAAIGATPVCSSSSTPSKRADGSASQLKAPRAPRPGPPTYVPFAPPFASLATVPETSPKRQYAVSPGVDFTRSA